MKRRASVLTGLADGAERAGVSDLGRAIGESLATLSAYPTGGRFLVPQRCPVSGCGAEETYGSKRALNRHLVVHELGDRQRSELCAAAMRNSVQAAMNGVSPHS